MMETTLRFKLWVLWKDGYSAFHCATLFNKNTDQINKYFTDFFISEKRLKQSDVNILKLDYIKNVEVELFYLLEKCAKFTANQSEIKRSKHLETIYVTFNWNE